MFSEQLLLFLRRRISLLINMLRLWEHRDNIGENRLFVFGGTVKKLSNPLDKNDKLVHTKHTKNYAKCLIAWFELVRRVRYE